MLRKSKAGFTLIETMITIVIIALVVVFVVAIANSMFKSSTEKAKVAQIVENIRVLEDAQSLFFAKHHAYGNKYELLSSGILKSWPVPDDSLKDGVCLENTGHSFEYQYWVANFSGDERLEIMTVLPCIKDEFAVEFNKLVL